MKRINVTGVLIVATIGVAALAAELQPTATENPVSTEQHVEAVFSRLRTIKPMEPGQKYTVRVAGGEETGYKEQLLRRRTASEICDSGLSCGCGDYALVFIDTIESRGFQALLVDGAEISSGSLWTHFSGHAVVAVRSTNARATEPWWLVDSTNLKILSQNWSLTNQSFQAFGSLFWIGYCGPWTNYPAHNAEQLKAFYTRTLAGIPHDLLNRTLFRLKYTVDPSLAGKDGGYLNPRLGEFLRLQSDVFSACGLKPEREIPILLMRGGDDARDELTYKEPGGWVGRIGLQSGCSPGLLSYFEHTIRSYEQQSTTVAHPRSTH